jgi:hypothetical protein
VRALVALSVLLAGCKMLSQVQPPGPLPDRIERRLVLGDPSGPTVIVESDWRREGDRHCARGGNVDIVTPAGPFTLYEADLCVTQLPASIDGRARVPMPGLGFLARIPFVGTAPAARITLNHGVLTVGKEKLDADPTRYYVLVDYVAQYELGLGSGSVQTANLTLDPHGPVIYLTGDMAGLLPATLRDVVLGFSTTGQLPYTSPRELYDGATFAPRTLSGHLLVQGKLPLDDYPIAVTGRFVVDLDADDDGQTVWQGDAGDLTLGGDATASAGYKVGGFDLALEVAQASVFYQRGAFSVAGTVPAAVLSRSPLSAFQPGKDLAFFALYRSAKDFVVMLRGDGQLLGFPLEATEITLGTGGVKLTARATFPGIGPTAIAGSFGGNGQYALSGKGDLTAGGLPLKNVEVTLTQAGASLAATAVYAGLSFKVLGKLSPGGQVSLVGELPLKTGPLTGTVQLVLDQQRGPSASFRGRVCAGACVDVPSIVLEPSGQVCPSFPIVGKKCVKAL